MAKETEGTALQQLEELRCSLRDKAGGDLRGLRTTMMALIGLRIDEAASGPRRALVGQLYDQCGLARGFSKGLPVLCAIATETGWTDAQLNSLRDRLEAMFEEMLAEIRDGLGRLCEELKPGDRDVSDS